MSKAPQGWEYVEGGDEVDNGTVPFGNSGREAERKEATHLRYPAGYGVDGLTPSTMPRLRFLTDDECDKANQMARLQADAVSKTECWAEDPDPYDADLCHIIALMNAGV